MRRHTQFDSGKQIPLALDLMAIPAGEPTLLAAYRRLELSRRLSFKQVMSDRAYAIGGRNLADAIAPRGTSGYATNGTPSTIEPAEDMDTLLAHRTGFHYSANAKGGRRCFADSIWPGASIRGSSILGIWPGIKRHTGACKTPHGTVLAFPLADELWHDAIDGIYRYRKSDIT